MTDFNYGALSLDELLPKPIIAHESTVLTTRYIYTYMLCEGVVGCIMSKKVCKLLCVFFSATNVWKLSLLYYSKLFFICIYRVSRFSPTQPVLVSGGIDETVAFYEPR